MERKDEAAALPPVLKLTEPGRTEALVGALHLALSHAIVHTAGVYDLATLLRSSEFREVVAEELLEHLDVQGWKFVREADDEKRTPLRAARRRFAAQLLKARRRALREYEQAGPDDAGQDSVFLEVQSRALDELHGQLVRGER